MRDERQDAKNAKVGKREIEKEIDMPFDDEDPPYVEPDAELDRLAHEVIGAAIEVHKRLGAGLDEGLYRAALCIELSRRDVQFACEVVVDVPYRDVVIGQKRI